MQHWSLYHGSHHLPRLCQNDITYVIAFHHKSVSGPSPVRLFCMITLRSYEDSLSLISSPVHAQLQISIASRRPRLRRPSLSRACQKPVVELPSPTSKRPT